MESNEIDSFWARQKGDPLADFENSKDMQKLIFLGFRQMIDLRDGKQ